MDLNAFEQKIRDGGSATHCEAINLAMYARELEILVAELRITGNLAVCYSNPDNYRQWKQLMSRFSGEES